MTIAEAAETFMPDLWDTRRVALSLGVCDETVRRLVRRGELPAIKVGGHVLRFDPLHVDMLRSRGQRLVREKVVADGASLAYLPPDHKRARPRFGVVKA
jgi:excisionase family DNA binding protein